MLVREIFSAFTLIMGVALVFLSLMLPPQGEIDVTVLNALAQLLVFSGACLGIEVYVNYAVNKQLNRLKDETRNEK